MYKAILFTAFFLGSLLVSQAQNLSENAIGLRLGDNSGFGAEISYQKKINIKNRIEIDLGLRNSNDVNAIKLAGLYQWVWKIEGDFNWYAGVGGGLGSWKSSKESNNSNGSFIFVAADIGIEYNFDIPLQIALDFRPELYLNNVAYRDDNFGSDIAFAVRYKF